MTVILIISGMIDGRPVMGIFDRAGNLKFIFDGDDENFVRELVSNRLFALISGEKTKMDYLLCNPHGSHTVQCFEIKEREKNSRGSGVKSGIFLNFKRGVGKNERQLFERCIRSMAEIEVSGIRRTISDVEDEADPVFNVEYPNEQDVFKFLAGKDLIFQNNSYLTNGIRDKSLVRSLKDALILERNSFLLRDEVIDVKVYLKNNTENVTVNQLESIDIGELDISQKKKKNNKKKSSWFFNESEDFCTAYRSETDEIHSTYFLTRFHRNPDWNSNPTCILFFRLSAFLLPGQGIRRKELLEDFTVRNCVSDMEYGIDTIFFNQDICRDYTDFKNLVEAFYDDIQGD